MSEPETIGELADRLPEGQWVSLPEYGVRVWKWDDPMTRLSVDYSAQLAEDGLEGEER